MACIVLEFWWISRNASPTTNEIYSGAHQNLDATTQTKQRIRDWIALASVALVFVVMAFIGACNELNPIY